MSLAQDIEALRYDEVVTESKVVPAPTVPPVICQAIGYGPLWLISYGWGLAAWHISYGILVMAY